MLYLIGIGLDKGDISSKALNVISKCKKIYLDSYTSHGVNIKDLEKLLKKRVVGLNRKDVESNKLIDLAKEKNIALIVYGDVFNATTHTSLVLEARKHGVKVDIVHGVSIFDYISEIGLFMYKFGAVASIPFDNKNVKTPYEIFEMNYENGWHTLFLLDLDPKDNKYMNVKDALNYLIKQGLDKNILCIGCSFGKEKIIKIRKAKEFIDDIKQCPQCLIIPGKLHFIESEAIERFK